MEKRDWLRQQERNRDTKPAPEDSRTVRMAQILAGKLSKTREWSEFQKYAASNIARLEMIVESYKGPLLSHNIVDADELMKAKIGLHAHQAALEAYKDILDFPNKFKKVDDNS